MSDTPRTDAAQSVTVVSTTDEFVTARFARALERDNAELREALGGLVSTAEHLLDYYKATIAFPDHYYRRLNEARAALKAKP